LLLLQLRRLLRTLTLLLTARRAIAVLGLLTIALAVTLRSRRRSLRLIAGGRRPFVVVPVGANRHCFLNSIVFLQRTLRLFTRPKSLFFSNLFGQIHRDVAEAFELAREAPAIDEMPRADQTQLFRAGRKNVVLALHDAHATLGAGRYALANRFYVQSMILRHVHHGFTWFDLELNVLRNELNFHRFNF
jgi:hypothetical protein